MASSGEVRQAYVKFVGQGFRHHDPLFEGSAESLMTAMEENAREYPHKILHVKHAVEEGDFVAIHSHVRLRPDGSGTAVFHLFRFEEDRIAELWDIGQPVPDGSPNQYGMF
jgi:predicted SnoaL-like aldol condensation-catalyzing enzyme